MFFAIYPERLFTRHDVFRVGPFRHQVFLIVSDRHKPHGIHFRIVIIFSKMPKVNQHTVKSGRLQGWRHRIESTFQVGLPGKNQFRWIATCVSGVFNTPVGGIGTPSKWQRVYPGTFKIFIPGKVEDGGIKTFATDDSIIGIIRIFILFEVSQRQQPAHIIIILYRQNYFFVPCGLRGKNDLRCNTILGLQLYTFFKGV